MIDGRGTVNATLTGTISGSSIAFTLTAPFGSIGAPPGCTANGTGTASNATTSSITAVLTLTYTQACAGVIGGSTLTNQQTITMAK